jgi:hypothetical protein
MMPPVCSISLSLSQPPCSSSLSCSLSSTGSVRPSPLSSPCKQTKHFQMAGLSKTSRTTCHTCTIKVHDFPEQATPIHTLNNLLRPHLSFYKLL